MPRNDPPSGVTSITGRSRVATPPTAHADQRPAAGSPNLPSPPPTSRAEAFIRWVTRRHAADGLRATLTRHRLYILPTGAGGLFALLILALLAGSINYSNNLAFLLTFLVFGVAHNALWYTHRNLSGLTIEAPPRLRATAGQPIVASCQVSESQGRDRDGLTLRPADAPTVRGALERMRRSRAHETRHGGLYLPAHHSAELPLTLPEFVRGVHRMPRLVVDSRHPLGLLRCWSWLHFDTELIVAPRPVAPPPDAAPPLAASDHDAKVAHATPPNDGGDPDDLRDYRTGDPLSRIAWKPSARLDRWLLREDRPQAADGVWLSLAAQDGDDLEDRLERLAGWVERFAAEGRRFGLLLPDARIEPGLGPDHLDACHDALAACGHPRTADGAT